MGEVTNIFLGLILIGIVVYLWGMNILGIGTAAIEILKGSLSWIILLAGLLLLILGITDLKDK